MVNLELIGEGRTAEIYAIDPDRAVKLLRPGFDPHMLDLEAEYTAAAHRAGAPAPAVFGSIEIDGRPGIVFERVTGRSLARLALRRPWRLVSSARLAAEVQSRLHEYQCADLPDVSERLAAKITAADVLDSDLRRAALERLEELRGRRTSVLHGDFHADNILVGSSKPVVIDWIDAARGHPAADIARSQWLMSPAVIPPAAPFPSVLASLLARFVREYTVHYLRISGLEPALVEKWRLPVLAGRLSEGIAHEERALITEVRRLAAT